jgi:hypothetical protein
MRRAPLGDRLEGEARDVAARRPPWRKSLAAAAPGDRPVLLLSGGELTVTRRGDGVGGPNAEFCLALALAWTATRRSMPSPATPTASMARPRWRARWSAPTRWPAPLRRGWTRRRRWRATMRMASLPPSTARW